MVDAIRAAVPDDQTASAGLAQRQGLEPGPVLMGRADEALYVAKRAGRNRVAVA